MTIRDGRPEPKRGKKRRSSPSSESDEEEWTVREGASSNKSASQQQRRRGSPDTGKKKVLPEYTLTIQYILRQRKGVTNENTVFKYGNLNRRNLKYYNRIGSGSGAK